MENPEDFDRIVSDPVWDDVRGSRNYQFPSPWHSTGPAHRRMAAESVDCLGNSIYDSNRSCRIVSGNVFGLGIEIGDGFA